MANLGLELNWRLAIGTNAPSSLHCTGQVKAYQWASWTTQGKASHSTTKSLSSLQSERHLHGNPWQQIIKSYGRETKTPPTKLANSCHIFFLSIEPVKLFYALRTLSISGFLYISRYHKTLLTRSRRRHRVEFARFGVSCSATLS